VNLYLVYEWVRCKRKRFRVVVVEAVWREGSSTAKPQLQGNYTTVKKGGQDVDADLMNNLATDSRYQLSTTIPPLGMYAFRSVVRRQYQAECIRNLKNTSTADMFIRKYRI
jgi:hypothetical protein